MSDTVEQLIQEVSGITGADPLLARLWVRDGARRTLEFYHWSWLFKRTNLVIPATVTNVSLAATVTVTQGDDLITFSGSVASPDYVGRQFRTTTDRPIYDIREYVSSSQLRLSEPWADAGGPGQSFSIFLSRVPLPTDCTRLRSAVLPTNRWLLHTDVPQEQIDLYDPMRTRHGAGTPTCLSPLDYTQSARGTVDPAVRVVGAGNVPLSGGEYTGQSDALYTIIMTSTGLGGVATFSWRRDDGTLTAGVISDTGTGNDLSNGVNVLFNGAQTYTSGDVFVIRVSVVNNPGTMRVEVYPTPAARTIIPIYYISRPQDVLAEGVTLPGILAHRGDVIREKALEFAAAWAGSIDAANHYAQINRREYHAANWQQLVSELTRQDSELYQQNVRQIPNWTWAPLPWGGWSLQDYDPPYIYPH